MYILRDNKYLTQELVSVKMSKMKRADKKIWR